MLIEIGHQWKHKCLQKGCVQSKCFGESDVEKKENWIHQAVELQ